VEARCALTGQIRPPVACVVCALSLPAPGRGDAGGTRHKWRHAYAVPCHGGTRRAGRKAKRTKRNKARSGVNQTKQNETNVECEFQFGRARRETQSE
jgi:hypothetical protein